MHMNIKNPQKHRTWKRAKTQQLLSTIIQEAQLMLTTGSTRLAVNQGQDSTIPYVAYSFLLCNSNFVFKTRRFYDIRLQKCRDLETG